MTADPNDKRNSDLFHKNNSSVNWASKFERSSSSSSDESEKMPLETNNKPQLRHQLLQSSRYESDSEKSGQSR